MSIRILTAAECRGIASLLDRAIAKHTIRCSPGSDLATMLDAARWMGSFPDESPQPETAYRVDPQRGARAFLLIEQARRVAVAVTWVEDAHGLGDRAKFLKDRFNRLATQDARAQDALFEIEVAGRLARTGLTIEFDEPDIIVTAGTASLALACKRPRRQERIADRVSEAARQIEKQKHDGLIVIGIEALFHRADGRRVQHFETESDVELQQVTDHRMGEILTDIAPQLQRAFQSNQVVGIMLCGVVTAWSKIPSAYLYRWVRARLPNFGHAEPSLVNTIDQLMFEN
jgi:hypothetical protein